MVGHVADIVVVGEHDCEGGSVVGLAAHSSRGL